MKKLSEAVRIARRSLIALFAVIAAVSAYGRTVSVNSVERDSCNRIVRANLHLTTGDTAVLHIAWGTADGGSSIDAWDHHRPVAMVEGTTTSYAYTFPSDMGDDIAAVRFFLLEDYDIPLTKRYAYIETDGTQYVRTPFTPSGLSSVEMKLSLNSVTSSVALCCARTHINADTFTAFYIAQGGWRFDYFNQGGATPPLAEADRIYTLRLDRIGLCLDDDYIIEHYATTKVSGTSLLLFGAKLNPASAGADYKASVKLYSMKAWSNSVDLTSIAMDLIPTEQDGVPCLYNRVDGTYLKSFVAECPLGHGEEVAVMRPTILSQSGSLLGKFGAERTMQVVAKRRSSTTGLLSGLDLAFTTGLDRKLYVAYGDRDEGGDITSWSHVHLVSDVPGNVVEYSFDVPESWGSNVRAMRLFLLDREYIPGCDVVCEGVAVDGVYVATDFTPMSVSIIDMSLAFTSVSESQTIFCARDKASNPKSMTVFYIVNQGWRLDYDNTQNTSTASVELGRRYSLRVTGLGLSVNDVSIIRPAYREYTAGSTMALFVARYSGNPQSGSYPFKGIFYSLRAQQYSGDPNSVKLDLVPCQKGSKVCLFNRVNGDFLDFEGAGTAVPVGGVANGTVVSVTDAFSLFPLGFQISVR